MEHQQVQKQEVPATSDQKTDGLTSATEKTPVPIVVVLGDLKAGPEVNIKGSVDGGFICGDRTGDHFNDKVDQRKYTNTHLVADQTSGSSQSSSSKLYEKLVEYTKEQAGVVSGTKDGLAKEYNIRIAPLQISTQSSASMKEDNYHHRNDLASFFNKCPEGNIKYKDLFKEAFALARQEANKKTNNRPAQAFYERQHGNVVGVIGEAGMGKTTLTKVLAREVLNDKSYDTELLFYLRLRDFDQNPVTFLEFLTKSFFEKSELFVGHEDLNDTLEQIKKNSDKVMIILDGFDEVVTQTKVSSHNIYGKTHAENFLMDLLSGDLLPRAKKLITSRPSQLLKLAENFRPRFIVKILGIDETSQNQICSDICDDNPQHIEEVTKFLSDHPDLKSYSYVPVICILIMYCVYESISFKSSSDIQLQDMDSITTIVIAALHHFKKDHLKANDSTDPGEESANQDRSRPDLDDDHFQVQKLAKLAYDGFMKPQFKLTFDAKDLKEAGINDYNASAFLFAVLGNRKAKKRMIMRTNLQLMQGNEEKFYFSHLILQECFVALYLVLFSTLEEILNFSEMIFDDKFEIVSTFLFGLFNVVTLDNVPMLGLANELEERKKSGMFHKVKQLLLSKIVYLFAENSWISKLRVICTWLYELRDDNVTKKIASLLDSEIDLPSGFSSNFLPGLKYVLNARRSSLTLNVYSSEADKDVIGELQKIFEGNTNIKVTLSTTQERRSLHKSDNSPFQISSFATPPMKHSSER